MTHIPLMVSVVIPNWNGKSLLEKNLPQVISAFENKVNHIVEIVVIDDGSTDDSVVFLKKIYDGKVRVIVFPQNRGFSNAVNAGVRLAKGDLIALLNTDVILKGDFLKEVLDRFDDVQVFAVGLHEKGYGPSTAQFVDGYFGHSGLGEQNKISISMWASGGSAIFRKSIWKKLHGFDEELFSPFYWEDVDISYRAWKRGYKVLWEPSAHVLHAHESVINTNNFKARFMNLIKERNELLFIWKNISSKTLIQKHKKALLTRMTKHPGYCVVVWMALQKRKIVLERRAQELKESKISDEAVFSNFSK